MIQIQKEGPTLWLRWFCTWHRPIRKSTNGSTLTERKNILVLLAILALQIASLYRTACWGRWFLIFLRDTKSSHPLHLDGLMPCTKKPSAKGPAAREGSCHLTWQAQGLQGLQGLQASKSLITDISQDQPRHCTQ